jgi:flagellar biosynthetic protein FliS
MNEQPYNHAVSAYRKAQEHALHPVDIVVALYQGMLKNLNEAKVAYENRDLDKMCAINEKTFRILAALQCHLDFEQGKNTAITLDSFYTAFFVRLVRVLETPAPVQEYSYLEATLHDVYDEWKKLAEKSRFSMLEAPRVP